MMYFQHAYATVELPHSLLPVAFENLCTHSAYARIPISRTASIGSSTTPILQAGETASVRIPP
jgi:hypothetical protein